jgi:DegT/DnrJ/EryC1/StrS aminotransferase family
MSKATMTNFDQAIDKTMLAEQFTERMGRQYGRLAGRGTAALYLAFRAIAVLNGPGEIIVPDLICSTALDAVLLAGHIPVFADVVPGRWTIDKADALRRVTDRTRGVLVAHLFGHIADFPRAPFSERGIPIVEDAIQGLGGSVGSLGDLTVVGFADSKMIGGRGGLVMTDDRRLWDAIYRLSLAPEFFSIAESDARLRAYAPQVRATASTLILPFDESFVNQSRIQNDWKSLMERVQIQNACAVAWRTGLADLPLALPDLSEKDAVWRFTFAAPSASVTNLIAYKLHVAGIPGTRLYPSLDQWLPGSYLDLPYSVSITSRLINLWVTPPIAPNNALMAHAIDIIRSVCM